MVKSGVRIKHNKKLLIVIIVLIILVVLISFIIKDSDYEEECIWQDTQCCPCSSGGTEECMLKSEAETVRLGLENCPEDIVCLAVYNCHEDLDCKYIEGKCQEIKI